MLFRSVWKGVADSGVDQFQFRVSFCKLSDEPALRCDQLGILGREGWVSPMLGVGSEVGGVVEVEGRVAGGDDIVVHVPIRATDMAECAHASAPQFRLGIDQSKLVDCVLDTGCSLVVGIFPSFCGSMARLTADSFGSGWNEFIGGKIFRGVVASEAVLERGAIGEFSFDEIGRAHV